MIEEVKQEHQGWLNALLGQHDMTGIESKIHLVKGVPGKKNTIHS